MSHPDLTEGSLAVIMTGGVVDNPIMQVLGNKKITGANEDKERYRLLVSDGKYQISFAMIATQLNEKISSGELTNFTVIKIKKYITSVIKNAGQVDKRVLVILELDILAPGSEIRSRIGTPVSLPDNPHAALKSNQTNGTHSASETSKPTSSYQPEPSKPVAQTADAHNQFTLPISSLSPYQNKWVIKARVTNKSAIRTWSNSRGEGKLFSMDLMDESGEIRATGFRDAVDKFYEMIEIDKVYYISKCIIKMANKQFNNLNNDYEMTLGNDTTIQPCFDDVAVPKAHYNFVTIDKVVESDVGSVIDIIGVCKMASDVQNLTSKTTNRELKKRELTLVDQSHTAVSLTLWGNEAENFDGSSNPIVAIRGAKVGEFGGGKNLSVLMSSILKLNPDIPEAHRLRGWYDNSGKNEEINNISARSASGMPAQWLTFKEVKDRKLGSGERGDYYQCKATILLVNSNNSFYQACPTAECNKKVVDMKNGMYRCEKCNREYPQFKYRLILSMNLADWTDNQWVNTFTGEAEKILGKTSQEVGEEYEAKEDSLVETCTKANFSEYIFKCRAKFETYNDETRLKTAVIKVDPLNYKEYNSFLIGQIKQLVG